MSYFGKWHRLEFLSFINKNIEYKYKCRYIWRLNGELGKLWSHFLRRGSWFWAKYFLFNVFQCLGVLYVLYSCISIYEYVLILGWYFMAQFMRLGINRVRLPAWASLGYFSISKFCKSNRFAKIGDLRPWLDNTEW